MFSAAFGGATARAVDKASATVARRLWTVTLR
jgi:hypothetical protein